jgi:hypothetical protein
MIRPNKRLTPSDSMAVHFLNARLRLLGKKRDHRLGSSFLAPEFACEKNSERRIIQKISRNQEKTCLFQYVKPSPRGLERTHRRLTELCDISLRHTRSDALAEGPGGAFQASAPGGSATQPDGHLWPCGVGRLALIRTLFNG